MATASVDVIREVFSAALRDMPAARNAWMSSDEDGYHFWLLIGPSDMAQERQYYALLDRFYETFPSADFMLHVLNPRTYDELVPERIIPPSAINVSGYGSA